MASVWACIEQGLTTGVTISLADITVSGLFCCVTEKARHLSRIPCSWM